MAIGILSCVPVMWISCYYARDRKPPVRAKLLGLIVIVIAVIIN